uniref:Gamma-secretase-activating protein C-terminal domain-containing protein n=1 Tax=Heliothis virescens TaxID=7102 RepID=A0A2A4JXP5_HELVI
MAVQNIAVKLCGVLQAQGEEEVTAREWRLLGQEQDGSQLLSWVSDKDSKEVLNLGSYTNKTKTLITLHTFDEKLNIIQASVNATHTLLVYIVKILPNENNEVKDPLYCPFLICLLPDADRTPTAVEEPSTKQIMVQYVYGKSTKYSPGIRNDRFLLFKHLECIKIYRTPMFLNECDDGTDKWGFDGIYPEPEKIVKVFSWAQWDCVNQVLYYIHYRLPTQSFAEGEEVKSPSEMTPTLSALQFHADLPHETVLNIPLSLPHVSSSGEGAACGAYEDDPIPLRVHDCSLDLQIVCDQKGVLCICHHYLYKPLDDSTTSLVLEDSADLKDSGVNFAYSITLLQHGCVVLYYIHYRLPTQSFAEGEEVKSPSEMTPTLSALQFHADLPHETVLNIPLSLPHVSSSGEGAACGAYEDDPIPLRVHDCSLDLQIVCDQKGVLCICHHYLYKPLDDSTTSLVLEDSADLKDSGVNFAYSITLLQHGCVVHSVVPDLPWSLAKSLRPSYTLYADNHLLVNIPMLYTQMIDISLYHEPCCHIVLPMDECDSGPSLAPVLGWGAHAMVDLNTLDVVTMTVADKDLTATFKSNTAVENKLAILHYLIQHDGNMDLAEELISWMCLNQRDGLGAFQRVMQEYLVGTTYAVTRRSLPASALGLMKMLPFTQHLKFADVKVRDMCVSVSQEKLWNSAVVVLAPRQRVCQFAEDVWTRLWRALNDTAHKRLQPQAVIDKLRVSLHCYQPEALSRCSTPLSPGAPPPPLSAPQRRSSIGSGQDLLPFFELDVCTASKQEHIIAANLREVSVHLMRECSGGGSGGSGGNSTGGAGQGARGVESGVHAVATRWAAAQLDAARALCRALTRPLAATPQNNQQRGFTFIDEMDPTHAFIVFKVLEQYYLATDSIAFPLPQGFSSFFTYLGYRTLPFHSFVQYVHRNVFELQIDVMKAIIASKDDDNKTTVNNKLRLIQLCERVGL